MLTTLIESTLEQTAHNIINRYINHCNNPLYQPPSMKLTTALLFLCSILSIASVSTPSTPTTGRETQSNMISPTR
jgi:hypothetical protein